MKKIIALSIFLLLMIAGCAGNDHQNTGTEPENASGERENEEQEEQIVLIENPEVIAENLEIPWSIEKLEDTIYLTERPGYIIRMENLNGKT